MSAGVRLKQARLWASPAPLGARVLAYTIDVVVVVAAGVIAGLLVRSVLIGVIMALQVAGILTIAEGRSGITPGNRIVNLRTTRDDVPYSLGAGRAWIRAVIQGVAFLLAAIGGWLQTLTSLGDPHRMGRTWADRAARALVVRVPEPEELEALSGWIVENRDRVATTEVPEAPAVAAPAATAAPSTASQPGPGTGAYAQAFSGTLSAPLVPTPAPVQVEPAGPRILLRFDTGQVGTFAVPGAVNLGRRPDPQSADDHLLAVTDPDRSVSKNHLRLEVRSDSVWLTDLNSTNGSEIFDDTGESSRLVAGERVRLDEGAWVRIGNRSFTISPVGGAE